jgi:hypothetical protein
MGMLNWLRSTWKAGDPLRAVGNARQQNRLANILNDLQGINCRVLKPTDAEGLGWRIAVDGGSDVPIPVGEAPPWAGGGGGGDTPDNVSIDRNGDSELQVHDFDDAADAGTISTTADFIPFKDADASPNPIIKWISPLAIWNALVSAWGEALPWLGDIIDDHSALTNLSKDDHSVGSMGPINDIGNGVPFMALGRHTDNSVTVAGMFTRNTRKAGVPLEDNYMGQSLHVENRVLASDNASTGGFAVSDHASSPTVHAGVTSAKLLRLPCSDGTYVEGYLRGGIICTD